MELWRTYRACQLYRCTPAQLDEVPAEVIDWHLAIDGMVKELQQEDADGR